MKKNYNKVTTTKSQKELFVYVKPRLLELGNTNCIQGGSGDNNDGYNGWRSPR